MGLSGTAGHSSSLVLTQARSKKNPPTTLPADCNCVCVAPPGCRCCSLPLPPPLLPPLLLLLPPLPLPPLPPLLPLLPPPPLPLLLLLLPPPLLPRPPP